MTGDWNLRSFDVAADGNRFLMLKRSDRADADDRSSIVVVRNWQAELDRLLPAD